MLTPVKSPKETADLGGQGKMEDRKLVLAKLWVIYAKKSELISPLVERECGSLTLGDVDLLRSKDLTRG